MIDRYFIYPEGNSGIQYNKRKKKRIRNHIPETSEPVLFFYNIRHKYIVKTTITITITTHKLHPTQ